MQASQVWSRFGRVNNYVEPFAGSLGVLLNRPQPFIGAETVNDADGMVVNFWRALQADWQAVAEAAASPVSSLELWARGDWLVRRKECLRELLEADPNFYDTKVAGWWVWGQCAWIGSGWVDDSAARESVHRQRIHTSNPGKGVHRQRVHTSNTGMGASFADLSALAGRLRNVRLLCGDWTGAVQSGVLYYGTTCAVYLDPPYGTEAQRCAGLYATDSMDIAAQVKAWCASQTQTKRLRIALAGYAGEHDELGALGWSVEQWKPHGHGYGAAAAEDSAAAGRTNAGREVIWFSPSCEASPQLGLFSSEVQ